MHFCFEENVFEGIGAGWRSCAPAWSGLIVPTGVRRRGAIWRPRASRAASIDGRGDVCDGLWGPQETAR
jgi:hypothetical protein